MTTRATPGIRPGRNPSSFRRSNPQEELKSFARQFKGVLSFINRLRDRADDHCCPHGTTPRERYMIDLFQDRARTRGIKETLGYFKQLRVVLIRYLSGDPVISVNGVRLTKDGLPVCFQD